IGDRSSRTTAISRALCRAMVFRWSGRGNVDPRVARPPDAPMPPPLPLRKRLAFDLEKIPDFVVRLEQNQRGRRTIRKIIVGVIAKAEHPCNDDPRCDGHYGSRYLVGSSYCRSRPICAIANAMVIGITANTLKLTQVSVENERHTTSFSRARNVK